MSSIQIKLTLCKASVDCTVVNMVPTLKLNGTLIIETETNNQRQPISWKVDECIAYDRNALKRDNKLRISGEYKDENSKTHSIVATILITKETSRVVYNGGGYDDISGVFVVNGKPGNIEISFPEYGNHEYVNKRKKSLFSIAAITDLVRPLSGNKNKYDTKLTVGDKVSIARSGAEIEVEISNVVRGLKDSRIKYLAPRGGGGEDFWVIEEDEIINQKENVGNNKAHLKRDHALLNAPTLEIVPKNVFEKEEKEDVIMTDGTTVSPPVGKEDEEEKEEVMRYGKDTRVVKHDGDKEGTIVRVSGGQYYIKYDDGEEDGIGYDEDDLVTVFEVCTPESNETDDASITSSVKNNQTPEDDDNGNSDDGITLQDELDELEDKDNGSEGRKGGQSAEAVSAKGVPDKSVTEDSNVPKAVEGGDANEKENAAPKGDTENTGGEVTSKKFPSIPIAKFPSIPTIGGGGKKKKKKSKSGSPKSEDNNEAGIFRNTKKNKANVNNIIKKIVQEKKKVVASINRLDEVKKKMDAPGVDLEVKAIFLKYYLQMVNNNDLSMPADLRKNVYEPWEEACKEALGEMKLVKYDGEELDWNKLSVDEVRKLAKLLTL